ncbi:MAG: glycosyltransferase family 39 protein, partial [candidate division Zixibacteria bacterium]|nr:glycosyltransferase family 39 protein [candidate division Zixibacteria bacterium]
MSKKKKTKFSLPPEKVVKKKTLEEFFRDNYLYIFWGIIIAGAFLRLNHLTADPPFNLSYSLGPFTDEGAIAISARNKLFWGAWKMDDFFRMSISSLLSFIYFIIFKIAGTGFVQIRIVPIVASLGTIFLVFSILKKENNIKAAIFSSLFLAFSYFYVMHNRLALEETGLIFFLVLSIYFLLKGKDKKIFFLFSGLSLSVGIFFIKVSGIFFVPVIILEILRWGFLRDKPRMKKIGEALLYFLTGLFAGALIWFLLIVLPYKSTVINYILFHTLRSEAGKAQNLGELIKNLNSLGTSSKFFAQMFLLFISSFIYIIYWLRNIKEKIRLKSSLEFISVLWIIIGMLFLAYPNYQPIRYRLVLVPSMGILAGFLISKIVETSKVR